MPRCGGASGSVRQASQIHSAFWALEVKIFWPSIRQESPSRTARVRREARSVPLGLAVPDGEDGLSAQDPGQEEGLLLLGPVSHEGGSDGVEGDHRDGGARAVRLVEEDELFVGAPALAAVLLGPSEAEEPVGADPAEQPALGRGVGGGRWAVGHHVPEVRAEFGAQP